MSENRRETWELYSRAWREASRDGKAAALRQSVSAECVYTDPLTVANGHGELIEYMLAFHQQVPGGYFVTTWFMAHHDASIAKWNMLAGDGSIIGDGVSYARYNEKAELVAMTGFFETPGR